VEALRGRLQRAQVAQSLYRLATIDGWAMRLIGSFPLRAGHAPGVLEVRNPAADYPVIRAAASRLVHSRHINDVLAATYARVIVDEYQDCTEAQHEIVRGLAAILPVCVLGDPLQAIFNFAEPVVDWQRHVLGEFPDSGVLQTPWRWNRANAAPLGQWLLNVRNALIAGEPIDLRTAPPGVRWIPLDGVNDHRIRMIAAQTAPPGANGRVLIIADADNRRGQQDVAGQTPGAVTVESVELREMVQFGRTFRLDGGGALEQLLVYSDSLLVGLGAAEIRRRLDTLRRGTARNPATPVETSALAFSAAPTYQGAANLLNLWWEQPGVRTHRPGVLYASLQAMRLAAAGSCNFADATVRAREESRARGRPLPRRAVGSTLLLKGLEAECSVVLNPLALNAANLYVAMTRGSMLLVICSVSPILNI
jgi:DNA helicase-2/ATP-dependent DNA helicase PcrA